jgi:hypothetical protein
MQMERDECIVLADATKTRSVALGDLRYIMWLVQY